MPALSSNNQKALLDLSRRSILAALRGETPDFSASDPELLQKAGCFVTLKKRGMLRGCIGTFDRETPLWENVRRMSRAAAFQDPRFPPVRRDEAGEITISISVLTEPFRVEDYQKLELGRHGIIVKYGHRSGTLLPEVAVEQGWTLDEFILYCAREKAGLTPDECAKAEIFAYEVLSFSE